MKSKITVVLLTGLLIMGCKPQEESESYSDDIVGDAVESGLNGIGGVADDLANESFALKARRGYSNIAYNAYDLFINEAFAANCARAASSACSGAVKSATYSGCSILGSAYTISGSVDLTFASPSICSSGLSSSGDSVTRTFDYSISGPRGGQIRLFSSAQNDYRGTSIGGGGRLTKSASGYDLEILGRNAVGNGPRGRTIFNVSVRTTSPIALTGTLSRNNRTVNGGAVEVNHNLAQFTAVHVPNNVSWNSNCCYPVSGSITSTFSGSIGGTATTTFNGCGRVQIDKDGQSREVELSYCE